MGVPWARVGSIFTRQFEDEVTWFAQRTDQTATSEYFGISWKTVGRIAKRVVDEKLDGSLLDELRFIGVDEISYGRPKKFLTVVVNHEKGKIVWAGEGQSAATLKKFFDELGPQRSAKLEAVSMDMDEAFKKAVRQAAPQAEIVYDRFHVVQLLSRAVDEVRRQEVSKALPEEKKELKSSRWPLLKNPWNLKPHEQEKLSTIQKTNRPLYRSYLIKESFQLIFNAETKDEAREIFDEWYGWARRSTLEPFKKVAITMKEHIDGILRFIEKKLTNSAAEGFNSKIRMISHRAFGFHSAQALIAMIYLNCSGIDITPLGAGYKFAT
jgi:transposase